MAQERGRELVAAATAVVIMMVTMPILFHYQVAEAAKQPVFTPVTWNTSNVFQRYPKGLTLPKGGTLVFIYESGKHDVMEVNQANYNNCIGVPGKPFPFEGGNLTTGTHYFVCSFANHCRNYGMKIKVNAK